MESLMPPRTTNKTRNSSYRRLVLTFTTIIAIEFCVCAIVNLVADPFWLFQHSNRFNAVQIAFNEREQKTNYLTYREAGYDSLLTGNSRVTFINQNDFKNEKVYNYALSAIALSEFNDYIKYSIKRPGSRIKTIYFGSSFASANLELEKTVPNNPKYYISKSVEPLHRLRMLFNLNLLPYSYRVIKDNLTAPVKGAHYNRHNVAYIIPFSGSEKETILNKDLNAYLNLYKNGFRYNREKLREELTKIVKENPDIRFVAFSPPVTREMHCLVRKAGLENHYFNWIEDMVGIFGTFHHFEYIHKIACDHSKFMDANHFLPEVGTIIVKRLQGEAISATNNFGIVINSNNIKQQLDFLKTNMEICIQ
jgi:hypothetical protein